MYKLFTLRQALPALFIFLSSFLGHALFANDLVVAQDGSGDYTTVQEAIDAAPTGQTEVFRIYIKEGIYKEKISIPSNKPFIQLVGESVANTILTYDDGASTPTPGGGTMGTQNSASFTVKAADFSAFNITFENSFGIGSQAVAVLVMADRAVFKNCRFLGFQDTLYTKGDDTPRHYFLNCYIDGDVDFIFGSSAAVFESCVIYAKARSNSGSSYITAANTPAGQAYGYVFRNAILPANTGETTYFLGRPWQNTSEHTPRAHNKTVFLNSVMSPSIKSEGWRDWNATTDTDLILYAEYQSRDFNGNLVDVSQRVPWSKQLTAEEAATYTNNHIFGDWDTCAVYPGLCDDFEPEVVVSNFRLTEGEEATSLQWNISWPVEGAVFELYRSEDGTNFSKIDEQAVSDISEVNYGFTDPAPAYGSQYYYYLEASGAGSTHRTETLLVDRTSSISFSGGLGKFIQYRDGTSTVQTYTVSGANLAGELTITPPTAFEVSADGGDSWHDNSNPLRLSPQEHQLPDMAIAVRLNTEAEGTYAGEIIHNSTGAEEIAVAVNGERLDQEPKVSERLQFWPLNSNNKDQASERFDGLAASEAAFHNLYSSNGTTVSGIKAYSSLYGQAFGASENGDGSWSESAGGPGADLNREVYQQFTITPHEGHAVRVDSLILSTAFYNTSENSYMAVAYSTSGFETGAADFTAAIGPEGSLPGDANGSFDNPLIVPRNNVGPRYTYRFALNKVEGVMLEPEETLTIRLYFSSADSGPGVYAMLKNVEIKGAGMEVSAPTLVLDGEVAAKLKVFPNPASNTLLVSHPENTTRGASIVLYSYTGKKITSYPVREGMAETSLNISSLQDGHYFIVFRSDSKQFPARLIKNRQAAAMR